MSQTVCLLPDSVIIDGKEYEYPNKRVNGHTVSQVNGRVFLDGYELTNGKWRMTFRSIIETMLAG